MSRLLRRRNGDAGADVRTRSFIWPVADEDVLRQLYFDNYSVRTYNMTRIDRRAFIATAAGAPSLLAASPRPNVLFVMADEWRAQATGYNGDPNVRTPA